MSHFADKQRCSRFKFEKSPLNMPLLIQSENSLTPVYLCLGGTVFGLIVGFWDSKLIIMAWVYAAISLVFLWAHWVASKRQVTLDKANGRVQISSVSLLFKPRTKSYPLELFGSVQSYLTVGKHPSNRVELVSRTGGEALLLAWFEPASTARSFWSFPSQGESSHAQSLRQSVAEQFELLDRGFLGGRAEGAQLKDC